MNEKFELHLQSIIKRLTKQVIITTILFIITLVVGIVLIFNKDKTTGGVVLVFNMVFLILTIIDLSFIHTNKKALKEYQTNKNKVVKKIDKQHKVYVYRGKGITKLLMIFLYKPLIKHYELALEALQIEEQIKI